VAKKKKYSLNDVMTSGVLERIITSRQPELLILRGHGLLEAALLTLLAARLHVAVDELPVFNSFESLARVALAGPSYTFMLGSVLHINRLRNIVAHELEAFDAENLMTEFVATMPPSLSDAGKQHGMPITETFGASLMVLMAALLHLHGDDSGTVDSDRAPATEG
jgi:hypothetical protein